MFNPAFFNTFIQELELLSALVGIFGGIVVVIVALIDPARRPTMKALAIAIGAFVAVMLILLLISGDVVNWSKQPGITQVTSTSHSTKTPTATATHRPSRTPTSTTQKPVTSTQTNSSSGTSHTTAPTTTPTPNPTPRPTPPPTSSISFDFESGTQNWGTSEGAYKEAVVSSTTAYAHTGTHSLEVTTVIQGDKSPAYNGNDVYRHTEATAYFNNAIPQNIGTPGPYSLTGKLVSCYVYLPSGLANGAYIRLFVKDTSYRNDFEDQVNITSANVNRWIQLSFFVNANPNNADQNFDSSQVNTIGVRIDTPDGSTLNFSGSFYIDDCSI